MGARRARERIVRMRRKVPQVGRSTQPRAACFAWCAVSEATPAAPPLPAPATKPERLGAYELLLELAAGGMATVHLARATDKRQGPPLVAVKRPHRHLQGDKTFLTMLVDEARLASAIDHPNVVKVRELGFDGGMPFIVMDYVEGTSLAELRRELSAIGRAIDVRVAVRDRPRRARRPARRPRAEGRQRQAAAHHPSRRLAPQRPPRLRRARVRHRLRHREGRGSHPDDAHPRGEGQARVPRARAHRQAPDLHGAERRLLDGGRPLGVLRRSAPLPWRRGRRHPAGGDGGADPDAAADRRAGAPGARRRHRPRALSRPRDALRYRARLRAGDRARRRSRAVSERTPTSHGSWRPSSADAWRCGRSTSAPPSVRASSRSCCARSGLPSRDRVSFADVPTGQLLAELAPPAPDGRYALGTELRVALANAAAPAHPLVGRRCRHRRHRPRRGPHARLRRAQPRARGPS